MSLEMLKVALSQRNKYYIIKGLLINTTLIGNINKLQNAPANMFNASRLQIDLNGNYPIIR